MTSGMLIAGVLAGCLQASEADAEKAIAQFKSAYRNPSENARALAVTDLGRTKHMKTLKMLAMFLQQDAPKVREAAAKALGEFTDFKRYAAPILQASLRGPNSKEFAVQAEILKSLGKLKEESSLPTLNKYTEEKYATVALGAIEGLGTFGHPSSLDVLHELMNKIDKWIERKQSGGYVGDDGQPGDDNKKKNRLEKIQKEIVKAFQTITGEPWTTAQEWNVWYERKRATFKPRQD